MIFAVINAYKNAKKTDIISEVISFYDAALKNVSLAHNAHTSNDIHGKILYLNKIEEIVVFLKNVINPKADFDIKDALMQYYDNILSLVYNCRTSVECDNDEYNKLSRCISIVRSSWLKKE